MIDVDPYWNEVFLNGANKLRVAQAVSLYGVARGAVVDVGVAEVWQPEPPVAVGMALLPWAGAAPCGAGAATAVWRLPQ